jgi:excisionase family DNA binding protein
MYSPIHTRFSVKEGLKIDCGLNIQLDQKEGPVVYDEAELLTVREVARQLRVDDTTVRRWIKNGVLEAITLPHRGARQAYRIRRSTLEALLAAPPQQIASQ